MPSPLELFNARPLLVRRERIDGLDLPRTVRLLYASDLHLGHRWTRHLADEIPRIARTLRPHAILLGGDLADATRGLADLGRCVSELAAVAPTFAVTGNHDRRAGLETVRAVLRDGGATLMTNPVAASRLAELTAEARVLCAHDPAVFPDAADAGFDLVLAGHLHGGQCVLWRRGDLLYPGALLNRWTGDRFRLKRSTMLVSRGAADTLPLRWNCPREVICCELS